MRKIILIPLFFLTICSVSVSEAAEKPGLADLAIETKSAIETLAPQLKQSKEQTDALAADNERNVKQYNFWDTERKKYDKPIADWVQRNNRFGEANSAYNSRADAYNAKCGGKTLPKPEYDICNRDREKLQSEKDSLAHVQQDIDKQRKELLRIVKPIEDEMVKLRASIKSNFEQWQNAKARHQDLKSRLDTMRARMKEVCSAAQNKKGRDAAEALKHCHSVNWDGARRDLPPLGDVEPRPFKMSPN